MIENLVKKIESFGFSDKDLQERILDLKKNAKYFSLASTSDTPHFKVGEPSEADLLIMKLVGVLVDVVCDLRCRVEELEQEIEKS